MTKTLTLAIDNFDQINTFNIEVAGRITFKHIKCQLRQGYKDKRDGIYWALNSGSTLKDTYTEADVAERERLYAETPVRNGDIVLIDGKPHKAKVLGAYSDACIFEAI